MLHADAGQVGRPISRMPRSVGIPHVLRDAAVHGHLVVGAGLAGLPHVVDLACGEVAGIVVHDDLVDLASLASLGHVGGEDEILVSLQILP